MSALTAILCVLLYLGLITSPGSYLESEIYNLERDNQAQVDAVENDPVLYPQVIDTYTPDTEWIHVETDTEHY